MRNAMFLALLPCLAPAWGQKPEALLSTRHEYVLHNFKTESGAVLPQVTVVYGTYGTLDAAKDNVVLLPSHYMAK